MYAFTSLTFAASAHGQLTINGHETTLNVSRVANITITDGLVRIVETDGIESVWTLGCQGARLAIEDGRIVAV